MACAESCPKLPIGAVEKEPTAGAAHLTAAIDKLAAAARTDAMAFDAERAAFGFGSDPTAASVGPFDAFETSVL